MEVCPAFIDETGILTGPPKQQPIYGISVLVIPDPKAITDSLYRLHFNFSADRMAERQHLRRTIRLRGTPPTLQEVDRLMHSTRHHEYKFTDVTRFNLQQYIDLLNLYFSFPEPQFHAMMLDRLDPSYSLSPWDGDPWKAYADLTRELLDRRLDRDVFAVVDLQDKPYKSPVYLEDTLCSVRSVKGCLRATSDMSIYLQTVDVLLGCVGFDWKDVKGYYSAASKRAGEKRALVNFVKSRLGLKSAESLAPGAHFAKDAAASRFTVWQHDWGR